MNPRASTSCTRVRRSSVLCIVRKQQRSNREATTEKQQQRSNNREATPRTNFRELTNPPDTSMSPFRRISATIATARARRASSDSTGSSSSPSCLFVIRSSASCPGDFRNPSGHGTSRIKSTMSSFEIVHLRSVGTWGGCGVKVIYNRG